MQSQYTIGFVIQRYFLQHSSLNDYLASSSNRLSESFKMSIHLAKIDQNNNRLAIMQITGTYTNRNSMRGARRSFFIVEIYKQDKF